MRPARKAAAANPAPDDYLKAGSFPAVLPFAGRDAVAWPAKAEGELPALRTELAADQDRLEAAGITCATMRSSAPVDPFL